MVSGRKVNADCTLGGGGVKSKKFPVLFKIKIYIIFQVKVK